MIGIHARPIRFIGALALALGIASQARGAALAAPPAQARITSLALFKNGLGFTTREAAVPGDGGSFTLAPIPVPVHGTFWATVPGKPAALHSVQAFTAERLDSVTVSTPGELLAANLGRTLEVRLSSGETFRGKVVQAGEPGLEAAPDRERILPAPGAGLALLETSGGLVAFSVASVERVLCPGGKLGTRLARTERAAALRVRTQGAAGQTLRVQSLARGIAWAPSYIVELLDGERARLIVRAEIVNDLEDLDRVAVSFVTGYPNVRFANVDDPIGLRGDLAAFLAALQGEGGTYGARGGVMSQMAYKDDEERRDTGGGLEIAPGQTLEEMYFYGPREVSLAKGQRGYYPLFELTVPCEHRYTLHPADLLAASAQQSGTQPPGPEPSEDVWHSVRLENTGKVPWTTAPASAFKDGELLAQDVLPNTPAGGRGTLRITKALDIRAEAVETEVDRKRNAATYYGSSYDLVEVRGRMSVTSYRDADVKLEATKDVSGEVLSSSPQARVETTARGLRAINPSSVLTWELPLKARGKLEIDYRYHILLRE